jgi:putative lipoprotein
MKVRKIAVFSLIISVIWLSFSCNPALGSAWYSRAASQGKGNETQPPIDNGDEEVPEEPQNPGDYIEVNPFEYFNENYVYPASKFDEWVVYMTAITATNVASYKFEPVTPWTDNGMGEYEYLGRDGKGKVIGEGQLNKTWNLKYYMYKTRKDRWAKSNKFNPNLTAEEAAKQKRFCFYRFTGDASAGTKLDNSTFCVDTYSKFLFFYSEPATKKVTFGNTIPSDWRDYESESHDKHTKKDKKFYEYDPVGYVMEDGSVVIYNWFKAQIIASNYSPSMNEKYKYVAKAGKPGEKGRPGHSPYKYEKLKIYGAENEEDQAPTLRIAPVYLKNISILGIYWNWLSQATPADPVFSYSYKAKLSYSDNGNTPIIEEELADHNHGASTSNKNKCQAIKLGEEITFTPKLLQKEIPNDAEHIEAELILQIIKYNTKVGGTTQEEYISKFKNSIKITYDKAAKKWLCPAANKKEILPGVKMSYRAFELKRGKLKIFKILFESTGAEGDVEAAYMISWN